MLLLLASNNLIKPLLVSISSASLFIVNSKRVESGLQTLNILEQAMISFSVLIISFVVIIGFLVFILAPLIKVNVILYVAILMPSIRINENGL